MVWLLLSFLIRRIFLGASMKKKIIITSVVALMFCAVIVNTMADSSFLAPFSGVSVQKVSTTSDSGIVDPFHKTKEASITDSKSGNAHTQLSMLMIGLALVGLASFRESKEKKGSDQLDRQTQ
jgi:hypothetical protein